MTKRMRAARVVAMAFVLVAALAVVNAGEGSALTAVTVTDSIGEPNNRTSTDPTPNAFDGTTATFTWTTESGNLTNPSYLEAGFASTTINRIRIFKDPSYGPHDLVIQTTTDTGALTARTWTNVSGLTNGFGGSELLTATSVSSSGTVAGDNHDSNTSGFASLTFNPVTATGLRIGFSTLGGSNNHYHVNELEIYPAPATGVRSITVVTPNGGETLTRGQPYVVRWTFKNAAGDTIKIVLFKGNTAVSTLAKAKDIGTGGKGTFRRTLPNWLPPGNDYTIHVQINGRVAHDESDAPFTIV
jgi:hypothetical protein